MMKIVDYRKVRPGNRLTVGDRVHFVLKITIEALNGRGFM
jgi:hypothetical protein